MTKEIRLPAPHPRLRPRFEGDLRRPGHPGTAVRIGEDLYEVVAAERTGGEWVYRIEPWTGRDTIRVYVEWGEGAPREFAAGLRRDREREKRGFFTWAGQAFLGFLPARRQERRCQEAGLDAARATLWSAALEAIAALPFAFLFFVGLVAGRAGVSAGSIPAWAGLPACFFLAEGAFRLAAVLSTGEPIGSLVLALLDLRSRDDGPEAAPRGGAQGPFGGAEGLVGEGGGGFPVLDPELEKARNRSSDLSYVFAPLWGFLPAELQKTLESYGRYRPFPNVIVSAGINVLIALALAGPGLRAVSQGSFGVWSLVKLAAAAGLFTESALRLLRLLRDGQTSGSLLGLVVRPLYDWAIKGRPTPRA